MFWGIFRNTNSVTVCQNSAFAKLWVIKNEVFEKKIAFFVFSFLCWRNRNKKIKWKRPKNPIKIGFFFFFGWSSKNVKNQKKRIFSRKCLTLFVSGREKKRAFSCTLSVLAKMFFGPKQCKAGNTIKIGVSAEIAKNKMTSFFGKGCFLTWLKKVGFTNCVFEKAVFS